MVTSNGVFNLQLQSIRVMTLRVNQTQDSKAWDSSNHFTVESNNTNLEGISSINPQFARKPSKQSRKNNLRVAAVTVFILGLAIYGFIQLNRYINERNRQCFINFPPWEPDSPTDLGEGQILVDTRYDGVKIVVDAEDQTVSRTIMKEGTWDPVNTITFGRFVKQGDTFVNIGAHIGLEGVIYGKKVGPKGKAFYFEPTMRTNKILRKNIQINGLENIATVYNKGVSNVKFTGYSISNSDNTGGARLVDENILSTLEGTYENINKVQIDTVDNILPKNVKINFALIDVESLEVPCLLGMKQVLARSPDIIIVTEWWAKSFVYSQEEYQDKLHQLLDFLDSHHLTIWTIDRTWFGLGGPKGCGKQNFIKWTRQTFEQFNDWILYHDQMMDIMIAADHIDLNTL